MIPIFARVAVVGLILTGVGSVPVRAQQGGPGGRALYEGNQEDRESRQSLTLSGSFFETYDDNVIAGEAGLSPVTDARANDGGFYSRADLGLFYSRRTTRSSFAAGTGAGVNYYPDLEHATHPSYRANADASTTAGRTRLSVNASASRLPYFLFSAFPAFVDPQTALVADSGLTWAPELAVVSTRAYMYGAGGRLTHPMGRRASLEATYDFRASRYGSTAYTDQDEHMVGIRANAQTGRYTSVGAGYAYRVAEYNRDALLLPTFQNQFDSHDIEMHVTHGRPLSASRRIALSAGAGTSIMERNPLIGQLADRKHYYRASGYSSLTYDFSRAWTARGEFRRSLEFVDGLAQPYFGNGVSASLGGLITRRLQLGLTGRYSRSKIGVEAQDRGYDSRTGSATLQYALMRQMALTVEYVYYAYEFTDVAELPPGFRRSMERQLIRAGISFGVPLLRRQPMP